MDERRWMNGDGCQHRLMDVPKYTRMEYERRFLVHPASVWQQNIKPYFKLFDDRYSVAASPSTHTEFRFEPGGMEADEEV